MGVRVLHVSMLRCFVLFLSVLGFGVSDFCHEAVAWKEDKQWHLELREERVSGDVLFRAVEQSA